MSKPHILPTSKLPAMIQFGLLVLVALMPFHAFFSVWLGSLTGHQAIIQAWKEVLLLILAGLGAIYIATNPTARAKLQLWPVRLSFAFVAVSIIITLITRPSLTAIAFGAKTDLEFLLAFLLAILVTTTAFTRRLVQLLLIAAAIVIAFGLLQFTILPADFLTRFGYGPTTIPPYLGLDPAVQNLRFGSTLGGPNQLGTYLLLPLALASLIAFRRRRWWLLVFVGAGVLVLVHTYSRSAWLAAAAASLVVMAVLIPARLRLLAIGLLGLLGGAGAWITSRLLRQDSNLQYYLLHSNAAWHDQRGSDFEHLTSLRDGVAASLKQPFGHGLGTAGPAVFHTANGPIIENNYLQLAYETGLPGLALFLSVVASIIWSLSRLAHRHVLAAATLAAIVGISIAALVLPAWTDSTTALTVWIAAGSLVGLKLRDGEHV